LLSAARAVRVIAIPAGPVSLARIEHGQTKQRFTCAHGYSKKKNAMADTDLPSAFMPWGSTRRKRRGMSRIAALTGSPWTGRRCWPQWCEHWAPTVFSQARQRRRTCRQGLKPDCHTPETHSLRRIFYIDIHRWAYTTSLINSKMKHFEDRLFISCLHEKKTAGDLYV